MKGCSLEISETPYSPGMNLLASEVGRGAR
jgi:hypothetical protein